MKEMLILEGKMGMSYGREFRPVRIENTIFDDITKDMVLDEIGETGNKRLFIYGEYSTGKTTLSRVAVRRYMEDGNLGIIENRMWDKFCKKGNIEWNPNVHIISCAKYRAVEDLEYLLNSIEGLRKRTKGNEGKEAFLILHTDVLGLDSQLLLMDYLKDHVGKNALVIMTADNWENVLVDLKCGFTTVGLDRFNDFQIMNCLKKVCDELRITYTQEVLQYIIDKSCHTLKTALITLEYVTSGGDLSYSRVVELLNEED